MVIIWTFANGIALFKITDAEMLRTILVGHI